MLYPSFIARNLKLNVPNVGMCVRSARVNGFAFLI